LFQDRERLQRHIETAIDCGQSIICFRLHDLLMM
jgi:hypothetical protein